MHIDLDSINDIAVALVSISAALVILGKAFRRIYKATKTIDLVLHEVVPNAGSSLRDVVDRIELRQQEMKINQLEMQVRLEVIEDKLFESDN